MRGTLCEVIDNKAQYTILEGNIIDKLREIPDRIIQTVVTSPPYVYQRSYDTDPQIWGGDKDCEHSFDGVEKIQNYGSRQGKGKSLINHPKLKNVKDRRTDGGSICYKCRAYKGEFGLNTNPDCMSVVKGLEPCGSCYVCCSVLIFREIRRVLRDDGSIHYNISDTYADGVVGITKKSLMLIPQRLALALQCDGWILRQTNIWEKPSCVPQSVTDRTTTNYEYIFHIVKKSKYYYDYIAVRESAKNTSRTSATFKRFDTKMNELSGGSHRENRQDTLPSLYRNKRAVFHISAEPLKHAHFAAFPTRIPQYAVLSSTSECGQCSDCGTPYSRRIDKEQMPDQETDNLTDVKTVGWESDCDCGSQSISQIVLDPFCGSGTSGIVALNNGRRFIGIELNKKYVELSHRRISDETALGTSKPLEDYF